MAIFFIACALLLAVLFVPYFLQSVFLHIEPYPQYHIYLDVSGKRNVDAWQMVSDHVYENANYEDLRRHHLRSVGAWDARVQEILSKSVLLYKLHVKRQYADALHDAGREFVFCGIRERTAYKQVNYVKHAYKKQVTDFEISLSWDDVMKLREKTGQVDPFGHSTETLWHRDKDRFVREQRAKMTDELRMLVKERDNYTCQQCGRYMPDSFGLHIDHIVPVSKGGPTELGNLQVLCEKCNLKKSNK